LLLIMTASVVCTEGCGRPQKVAFASLSPQFIWRQWFFLQELVSYHCNIGYTVSGFSYSIRCVEGGWTKHKFSCVLVTCKVLVEPENGFISVATEPVYGSVASYMCADGYSLVGPQLRRCMQDGIWSDIDPVCEALSCPQPPDVANSAVVQMAQGTFSLGDSVMYACRDGFSISGEAHITCLESGIWSKPPKCIDEDCGNPGSPRHGRLEGSSFTEGDSATFVCDIGYKIGGKDHINTTCDSDGRWSRPLQDCELLSCGSPQPILNGRWTGNLTYGQVITYSCNEGVKFSDGIMVESTSIVVCQANGLWLGRPPTCERKQTCAPPLPRTHSVASLPPVKTLGRQYPGSPRGTVASLPPVKTSGRQQSETQKCPHTGLLGRFPRCVTTRLAKTCPALSAPRDGFIENDEVTVGTVVIFGCNKGYKLAGKPTTECQPSLTWSSSIPSCQMVTCRAAPLEHGRVNVTAVTPFGSAAAYDCDLGFVLVGQRVRVCLDTGEWSGSNPHCHRIKCKTPLELQHGEVVVDRENLNRVIYVCHEGLVLEGPNVRMCTDAGTWSGTEPKCR
uniref:Sushi domain-containing protein n=1 Tax=Petromyzon marinus TaxID=7757 RepID=S4RDR7_PETMA